MKKLLFLLKERNPRLSNKKRADMYRSKLGRMGKDCEVFMKVSFGSEPYLIELGNNVRITHGVKFITHDGGIHVLRNLGLAENRAVYGKICVGNNTFIGNNAIILPGVKIGDNCIIGAGSVVTRSIPSNSVVAGVPAKVLRTIQEYYDKNEPIMHETLKMTAIEKKEYLLKADVSKFIEK
ncbi:acyltransferase [Bacillus luti]|uniref:acyltransferase n=1 Tax=Bacillus luti TaxID=2026191 RepID=UPI0012E83EE0|nr:acyltransferase [Bacillus luti]